MSAKSAPAYTWNFSGPLNASTALYCLGYFSCRRLAILTISTLPPPIITICMLVFWSATSSAANMISTPFCTSRRPRKHINGADGSIGSLNLACSAALHKPLFSNDSGPNVAARFAFIFIVWLLGVMLSFSPFRIPITPPRDWATFISSTPFSSVVSISTAYVSDTVAMRSANRKPPSIQLRQSTRGWRLPTLSGICARILSMYFCGRLRICEWSSWYGARPWYTMLWLTKMVLVFFQEPGCAVRSISRYMGSSDECQSLHMITQFSPYGVPPSARPLIAANAACWNMLKRCWLSV
mmetsp:Transcript_1485/g.3113  ORF Transcript_1485/g.3113 Transcript_1485/m.3113 type:complete len:296 (+) Transcript_1485:22-909(+)